jgi:hypothetical protein
MLTETSPSLQYLVSGIYEQTLTVARSAAFEQMVETMDQLIACHTSTQPLYLLQDASSLDLAYTPRVRALAEGLTQQLHRSGKTIRLAIVLPLMVGNCTDFLNCLLRPRETSQIRHQCFTTREDALNWLQAIHCSEAAAAAQGV